MASVEDILISEIPTTLRNKLCNLAADLASTGDASEAARVLCTALRDCVNLDPLRKPLEFSLIMRSIAHVLNHLPITDSLRGTLIRTYGKLQSRPRAVAASEAAALIEASLHAVEGGPDAALAALGRREISIPKDGEASRWLRILRGKEPERSGISDLQFFEKNRGHLCDSEISKVLAKLPSDLQPLWLWQEKVLHSDFQCLADLLSLKPPEKFKSQLIGIYIEMYPEDAEAINVASQKYTNETQLWDNERLNLFFVLFWSEFAVKMRKIPTLKAASVLLASLPPRVCEFLPEGRDVILARINLEISSRR